MSFEERLIEAVKENEVLYDLKNVNYRRIDKKEKIWEKISKDLNSTVDQCKKRWKSLRDKFIKLSKATMQPSGSGADFNDAIKWRYYSYLTFLQGFNKAEKTIGNYNEESAFESADESVPLSPTVSDSSTVEEPPRQKRRCGRKEDVDTKFKEVLNNAAEAIKGEINAKTSTQKLFEALAQRVDEANLSIQRLNELHLAATKLVYESI